MQRRITFPFGFSVLGLAFCSMMAVAQDTPAITDTPATATTPAQTSTTIDNVSGQTNKTPGADIDDTITNNYMRALSGSKSRWSIASQFYYMGGTITNPFGAERPNVAAGAAIPTASMVEGQISAKYNISAQHSVMVGTGLDWVTPFQGAATPASYNRKVDVYNPYVIYQYLYKWSGVQSALQFQPTFYTQTSSVEQGYTVDLALSQNNVYEIGHSGVSLGLYLASYDNPYFDKNGTQMLNGQMTNLAAGQADYGFGVDPFLEYQFNHTYNLRTVFNLWNYDHWLANPNLPNVSGTRAALVQEPWVQSLGVGIRVTRDLFFYPNVQFLPQQIRSDLTNVALYTIINVF